WIDWGHAGGIDLPSLRFFNSLCFVESSQSAARSKCDPQRPGSLAPAAPAGQTMQAKRDVKGHLGECLAALYLESRGYGVLGRNLRRGRHELDILAEQGDFLVAVEVKWRRGDAHGGALQAWDFGQRGRSRDFVLQLMAEHPEWHVRPWRFDLIAIEEYPDGFRLIHRRSAWCPSGTWW